MVIRVDPKSLLRDKEGGDRGREFASAAAEGGGGDEGEKAGEGKSASARHVAIRD